MLVVGSFIVGLDCHTKGIAVKIAQHAIRYGTDILTLLFLTPLPGTQLAERMKRENRIVACNFPEDWKYFTLAMPAMNYMNLSWREMFKEFEQSYHHFYSIPRILFRAFRSLLLNRRFLNFFLLIFISFSYRATSRSEQKQYAALQSDRGTPCRTSQVNGLCLYGPGAKHSISRQSKSRRSAGII